MKHKVFLALMAIAILTNACNDKDDDNIDDNAPIDGNNMVWDDLEYFQNAFVEIDSSGRLVNRNVGQPLYAVDTARIYVGVENMEEALSFFDAALSPEVARTVSVSNCYTYDFFDRDGKTQGTVSFEPNEDDGAIAEITTNLPDLKYFNRVTFIRKSYWPNNDAAGIHKIGDIIRYQTDIQKYPYTELNNVAFVCVREKSYGVKPIYVALTKTNEYTHAQALKIATTPVYPSNKNVVMVIANIISKNFEFFKAKFDEAGEGELSADTGYLNFVFSPGPPPMFCVVNLSTGKIQPEVTNGRTIKHPFMLRIDWLNE